MVVKVLFFASCRDLVGTPEALISLPDCARVTDLFARLAEEHPRLQDMEASLMVSVNQAYVDRTRRLGDGDEVAFIPPVSGGAPVGRVAKAESKEKRPHVR
ncbi:MAG: molybdopterin converting factor subunit 1 [Gemmatimonadota bacterium]|nr:molybdopterin converting factor subunit 1 [Gemmatimonadota bacterium]